MHKVLVIDDEEDFLSLLAIAIERNLENVEVMKTSSSEGAFQGISQFAPDLIITDLMMPGTSGLEFIARVKEVAPNIPIVAMSGFPSEMAKLQQQQPGIDLLSKPFPLEKLTEIVTTIFEIRV